MTSQELARRNNTLAHADEDRQWDRLFRQADMISRTKLVPAAYRGDPEACMSVMLAAQAYGMRPSVLIFRQFDPMPDGPEPRAQVYAGLAAAHGYDIEWPESTSERATVAIRKAGSGRDWQTFTFTAEDAKDAGRLDEWVERWTNTGETWPDSGKPKKSKETFVLGRPEVDVPDWAATEIRAGRTHRLDAWFLWRADMLAAKAIRRAVKRAAPEVMLGFEPIDTYIDIEPEDDEIEISAPVAVGAGFGGTEPAGPGAAADGRPTREPADAHPPARQPATHPRNAGHGDRGEPGTTPAAGGHETPGAAPTDEQIQRIQEALANLDGDGRAELNRRLGNFPKFGSDSFTAAHAQRTLLELGLIGAIPEAEA